MEKIINDKKLMKSFWDEHKAINDKKEILNTRFSEEVTAHVPEMDDDKFWEGIKILLEKMKESKRYVGTDGFHSMMNIIKRATGDFARDSSSKGKFVDFISFVKTYRRKSDALYKPCFDNITGCGDDGYSDFCDRLPLLGKKIYDKAVAGELKGEASDFEFEGNSEMYVGMRLSEAVDKFIPSFVYNQATRVEEEEEKDKLDNW